MQDPGNKVTIGLYCFCYTVVK